MPPSSELLFPGYLSLSLGLADNLDWASPALRNFESAHSSSPRVLGSATCPDLNLWLKDPEITGAGVPELCVSGEESVWRVTLNHHLTPFSGDPVE